MPGDSSGSMFLLQERFAVLPKQRLGWESCMSHNTAIFPAKKKYHSILKEEAVVGLVL